MLLTTNIYATLEATLIDFALKEVKHKLPPQVAYNRSGPHEIELRIGVGTVSPVGSQDQELLEQGEKILREELARLESLNRLLGGVYGLRPRKE